MANPGKSYNLPCSYNWYFGSSGGLSYITDYVKIGGREYLLYNTLIDGDTDEVE